MSFAKQTLGEIATLFPQAIPFFRKLDLDFCCGGAATLEQAVAEKNLNLEEIEANLTALSEQPQKTEEQDWRIAPYAETIDYIIERYHNGHRAQLPELIALAQKVEQVHTDREDCPRGVAARLEKIYNELVQHMMKEEQILFPMIKMGNYAMAAMPIRVMEMEHDEAGQDVEIVKTITHHLTAPEDACVSWRTLYQGINQFIDELMNHIHLENNILFPRVLSEK